MTSAVWPNHTNNGSDERILNLNTASHAEKDIAINDVKHTLPCIERKYETFVYVGKQEHSDHPFQLRENPWDAVDWLSFFFCLFVLLPIRLVFLSLCGVVALILTNLAILGIPESFFLQGPTIPLTLWRRQLLRPVRYIARIALFLLGVVVIESVADQDFVCNAPIIISNHISLLDTLYFYYRCLPSFLSKMEVASMPIFGAAIKATLSLFVDRTNVESRSRTVAEICRRLTNNNLKFPPILIFPESTTTNGRFVISFRKGAFLAASCVQPVAISYNTRTGWTPALVEDQGIIRVFLRLLCTIRTTMRVQWLAIYQPTNEECHSPRLFAENTRKYIANAIHAELSDHCYEDVLFQLAAMKIDLKMGKEVDLELMKWQELTGLDAMSAKRHLMKFVTADRMEDGFVTREDFNSALCLWRHGHVADTLFHYLDLNDRGKLTFVEYATGLSFFSRQCSSTKGLRATFFLLGGKDDVLFRTDFISTMSLIAIITCSEIEWVFDCMAGIRANNVTWKDFALFISQHPNFAAVFGSILLLIVQKCSVSV